MLHPLYGSGVWNESPVCLMQDINKVYFILHLHDSKYHFIICCYGSVKSGYSRLTAILHSNDLVDSIHVGRDFGITPMYPCISEELYEKHANN